MGWTTDDGTHEGWAGKLFADGWVASSYVNHGFEASWAPDGSFQWEQRTWRPSEAVVGWVPACECSWRGEAVTRAGTPEAAAAAGPGARTAYSKDGWLPEDLEEELIYPQWEAHVAPLDLAAAVSRAHREHVRAGQVLDEAVAAMRAAGASWGDVGRATGMTRQSANERWARRVAV
ncbi:hypothetical protein [Quadrisphaera sp. INWT6]|uniref:hypothetical protein n=1 Tax=Quadrisphaera sp. INWT6 TaxID=2596917 RepID=UPI0018920D3B|nr:hypothetical protein [Quadrisphaera sp. INWT6]MBF5083747.1 hypothetical protein [Quadrisphaera sp. INWT6]